MFVDKGQPYITLNSMSAEILLLLTALAMLNT